MYVILSSIFFFSFLTSQSEVDFEITIVYKGHFNSVKLVDTSTINPVNFLVTKISSCRTQEEEQRYRFTVYHFCFKLSLSLDYQWRDDADSKTSYLIKKYRESTLNRNHGAILTEKNARQGATLVKLEWS